MLPNLIQDIFNRVKGHGENAAVKIETPDITHTTHELVDLLTLSNREEKPSLYLIRPDRLTEYLWDKADWDWEKLQELSIEKSLEVIEKSKNELAVFIFWDISQRLDDRDGQPSVRSFIPQFFLSPKATRKFLVFLEQPGTQYPSIVTPYIISCCEHYPSQQELLPMVRREISLAGTEVEDKEVAASLLGLTYTADVPPAFLG